MKWRKWPLRQSCSCGESRALWLSSILIMTVISTVPTFSRTSQSCSPRWSISTSISWWLISIEQQLEKFILKTVDLMTDLIMYFAECFSSLWSALHNSSPITWSPINCNRQHRGPLSGQSDGQGCWARAFRNFISWRRYHCWQYYRFINRFDDDHCADFQ